jgi:hypothetical protein
MGHRRCFPRHCFTSLCCTGSLLHILIKIRGSSRTGRSRTSPFSLRENRCTLSYCCIRCPEACWIKAPETYYRRRVKLHSPKTGLFEVNRLATASCQSIAMFQQNCHACRLHLERVIARVGGSFSGYFLSYSPSPCALFKTIFFQGLEL